MDLICAGWFPGLPHRKTAAFRRGKASLLSAILICRWRMVISRRRWISVACDERSFTRETKTTKGESRSHRAPLPRHLGLLPILASLRLRSRPRSALETTAALVLDLPVGPLRHPDPAPIAHDISAQYLYFNKAHRRAPAIKPATLRLPR